MASNDLSETEIFEHFGAVVWNFYLLRRKGKKIMNYIVLGALTEKSAVRDESQSENESWKDSRGGLSWEKSWQE